MLSETALNDRTTVACFFSSEYNRTAQPNIQRTDEIHTKHQQAGYWFYEGLKLFSIIVLVFITCSIFS